MERMVFSNFCYFKLIILSPCLLVECVIVTVCMHGSNQFICIIYILSGHQREERPTDLSRERRNEEEPQHLWTVAV